MTRKKKTKSGNKISNLTNTILSILKKEKGKSLNYKQIAAILKLDDASSRNQIIKTLHALTAKKEIEEVERGKFKAVITVEYHTGILDLSAKGSGYVISDEFDDDDLLYTKIDDNNYSFDGKTPLKDFYKIIDLEDESDFEYHKGEAETVAGFVLEISGIFPKRNSKINFKNYVFTVEALDRKRIKQVKLTIN